MNPIGQRVQAAGKFTIAIRSRRGLFQDLYYATKTSAAESWELRQRVEAHNAKYPNSSGPVIIAGLFGEQAVAEANAQDSASAFVLLVDAILKRLASALQGSGIDTRGIGAELENGVRLNAAIWALANQARHPDEWRELSDEQQGQNRSIQILKQLRQDPLNLNAAREVVCALPVSSYIGLETMFLKTADELMTGTQQKLTLLGPATVQINRIVDLKDHREPSPDPNSTTLP